MAAPNTNTALSAVVAKIKSVHPVERHDNFVRTLTPTEMAQYKNIKGAGSQGRKQSFRELIASQRLKNLTASTTSITTHSDTDTTVGTYQTFWKIAQDEGGLMDKEFGMRIATNICSACERKGPPACLWDAGAGVMKYLHCVMGVTELQTRTRQSILSADVEMDPDTIRIALQQGSKEGLSTVVPPGQLGNLPTTAAIADGALAIADGALAIEDKHQLAAKLLQQLLAPAPAPVPAAVEAPPTTVEVPPAAAAAVAATPKRKATPKVRSVEDRLWAECTAFGRKLAGMTTHASTITRQAKEVDNDWSWARDQTSELQGQIEVANPVFYKWSAKIHTSSLANLMKQTGTSSDTIAWLEIWSM